MPFRRIWLAAILVTGPQLFPAAVAQPPAKPSAAPAIAPNLARLDQTLGGLDGPGFAMAYGEGSGILLAACEHGAIHGWNKEVTFGVRAGDGTPNVLRGHQGPVTALAWNGGSILASAGADQKILLWNMPDGEIAHSLAAGSVVRALAMSPDGKLLASGGDDPAVQLWDPSTGKPGLKLSAHTDWVVALAFSPDGKLLVSGGFDGIIRLWEAATGKKLFDIPAQAPPPPNTPAPPINIVRAITFSPDGKLLAAGGNDTQIHLFNPADGKYVRSLPGHTGCVTGLAFHPSGTVLASCSKDRTVRIWNPANGQPYTPQPLDKHTSWVQGLVFVAQGTRLASVGADQTVRLWDLTDPAKK
jgi:WD40 repeat protein